MASLHDSGGDVAKFALFELEVALKEGAKLVELLLWKGVVWVVVALGTSQAKAEERTPYRGDHFIEEHVFSLFSQVDVRHVLAGEEEASSDGGRVGLRVDLVPGDLLAHKLIVRKVVVKGLDDPVAVAPGIGTGFVMLEAIGLREPGKVEPLACPMFPISWGGEKTVDKPVVSIWTIVTQEILDFPCAWWEAGEAEGKATEKCTAVCFRCKG